MTDGKTAAAHPRARPWGPHGQGAAISFTFDNLGEAAEIEMGVWPTGARIGLHPSATEAVPRLLQLFPSLSATFFIEAWNCAIYPDTIADIAAAGHEVALHGWRHEVWGKLDEEAQRGVMRRSTAAMRAAGVAPKGFRPPGGQGSDLLPALLAQEEMTYMSDVGGVPDVRDGIVRLPFQWRGVDGVFLEPELGKAVGVSGADDAGIGGMLRSHKQAIADAKRTGGHVVFVFHPFLLAADMERFVALERLVDQALADDDLWVAPCDAVADWLLESEYHAPVPARHHGDGG